MYDQMMRYIYNRHKDRETEVLFMTMARKKGFTNGFEKRNQNSGSGKLRLAVKKYFADNQSQIVSALSRVGNMSEAYINID